MASLAQYRDVLIKCSPEDFGTQAASHPKLLIPSLSDVNLCTYYAPFEHVNREAKLVLVGITPGRTQMNSALSACCAALRAGRSDTEALRDAKRQASFDGKMRDKLVEMLDHYGVNRWLGIETTKQLWHDANHLVHFTSALRNPVFCVGKKGEADYTGGKPVLATHPRFAQPLKDLLAELQSINDALIIPLGAKVSAVLGRLVDCGELPRFRVLNCEGKVAELPHPSGQNAESQNLVLAKQMPEREAYAQEMLKDYLVKKAAAGEVVTADQRKTYVAKRKSYWTRGLHNRAALSSVFA